MQQCRCRHTSPATAKRRHDALVHTSPVLKYMNPSQFLQKNENASIQTAAIFLITVALSPGLTIHVVIRG